MGKKKQRIKPKQVDITDQVIPNKGKRRKDPHILFNISDNDETSDASPPEKRTAPVGPSTDQWETPKLPKRAPTVISDLDSPTSPSPSGSVMSNPVAPMQGVLPSGGTPPGPRYIQSPDEFLSALKMPEEMKPVIKSIFYFFDWHWKNREEEYKREINELREEVNQLSTRNFQEEMLQVLEERDLQQEKKNNVVIVGLKEEEKENLIEIATEMLAESGVEDPHSKITSVDRMGPSDPSHPRRKRDKNGKVYPRLVKLKMNSFNAKMAILRSQRELKAKIAEFAPEDGSSSYIRDDLTPYQFEKQKRLRDYKDQLTAKNPGKHYRIFNWKVVEDNRKY